MLYFKTGILQYIVSEVFTNNLLFGNTKSYLTKPSLLGRFLYGRYYHSEFLKYIPVFPIITTNSKNAILYRGV